MACLDLMPGGATPSWRSCVHAGASGRWLDCDVRQRSSVEDAVAQAIASFGRLDVCVDIIGEARWGRVLDLSDQDWD